MEQRWPKMVHLPYTAMLLYLFFDSVLSACPKKMEPEKWLKAADSPLNVGKIGVSPDSVAFCTLR